MWSDKIRVWIYQVLEPLVHKILPSHRFLWAEGDPLPEGAKWLECGHPSTDGSDELPSFVHEATGFRGEMGWCWWGHGWQDTVQRLRLVPDGESA